MHLAYRPTGPKDLAESFNLIKDRLFYPKQDQPRLFAFWRYLLKNRMALSTVVEDSERPAGKKICAFGMSLFVQDEFARQAQTVLDLPFSRRAFESWLKDRRVFLNRKEIAQHNSKDTLNLFVLHYGWEPRPSEEAVLLNAKFIESFFHIHSGYQIKEFLTENLTPEETAIILNHSLFLRWSFPEYDPAGARPFPHTLTGARREEYDSPQKMYAFALLLHAQRPRFSLSQGEKDVLERVLLGETDQETARSLHLTIWAIKKRWQGIYGKVDMADAGLLAKADAVGGSGEN